MCSGNVALASVAVPVSAIPVGLPQIRVYALTDCDWYAGADVQSCVDLYLANSGDAETLTEHGVPEPLADEDMERLEFHDMEEIPKVVRSFRAELDRLIASGAEFPVFFATSEY